MTSGITEPFHPGQRWISENEPELGLGSVSRVTARTVTIVFRASNETREYARDNTPLRRVRFRAGDTIKDQHGHSLTVQSVNDQGGLIFYHDGEQNLCETELSDTISFNKPEERLLAGQLDSPELFDLRLSALEHQHRRRKSVVRGFVGGRIDLIPHQLYIAAEVAGRLLPRVLLADEVGLGKTIEACLMVHRLLLTNRAQRVLILVPDSLVHQWFVELLRRFNLWFHIFDEERCAAIESTNTEINPFLDDQLVLASIHLFNGNPRRLEQALVAGWDLLVLDEAHHLGWSPEFVSPEYALVEALSQKTPGLLLLTATPEQLGVASHFARLRLLDPDRFYDLGEFVKETEQYRDVAALSEKLLSDQKFSGNDTKKLANILGETETSVVAKLNQVALADDRVRKAMLDALLDRHGTGRVMFRNTRATISGFPKRIARLYPLELATGGSQQFDDLAEEFANDTTIGGIKDFQPAFSKEARIDWLADLLRNLEQQKVLLICRTQSKVVAIDAALRERINVKMGVFHEGLSLVQRDRNAAWFAEDDGARILICSEIGSEGRNFQFAHHLVMFDLPPDPELLEQRIGRLDRIGQTEEIQIHVPFVAGSSMEVLARWYHDGLDSFQKNLPGGRVLLEQFGGRVHDLAQDFHETQETSRDGLESLIIDTRVARTELAKRLEQGRDRLLELNSNRPEVSARLVREIQAQDDDHRLDNFMIAMFDHYSVQVEELSHRTYQLGSAGVFADSFPGLPAEGLTVTCDRRRALSREDVQFLTWDHPLVTGALDLLLGSERGNSSFAKWPDAKTAGIYLETIFVLECIAPSQLHADRFLPPTPLRVLVDHRGKDAVGSIASEMLQRNLKKGDAYALLDHAEFREALFPDLLEKAQATASHSVPAIIIKARNEMTNQLDHEIGRLNDLRKVNRSVRQEEIDLLLEQRVALECRLQGARLRLDAVRLIQRGPG